MRSVFIFFKVMVIMFWMFIFLSFGLFVFFGEPIRAFLNTIPLIVSIKEYFELDMTNIESFVIFLMIIMIPITLIVFKVSKRFTRKEKKVISMQVPSGALINNGKTSPTVKNKAKKKSVFSLLKSKPKESAKPKQETPTKQIVDKPVKISGKTIGLTGLQIK